MQLDDEFNQSLKTNFTIMKKLNLIIMLLISVITTNAQQVELKVEKNRSNNLSLGLHLNNFQNDFGQGISVTSPFFANNSIAFKGSFNVAYRDGIVEGDSISNWYAYSSVQFGTIAVAGKIGESIRAYGSGGVIVLFPNAVFSNHKTQIGGYGLWGFEFILNSRISYYVELGGMGVGARAEKMIGQPIYSNGFLTTVGLHFYL